MSAVSDGMFHKWYPRIATVGILSFLAFLPSAALSNVYPMFTVVAVSLLAMTLLTFAACMLLVLWNL